MEWTKDDFLITTVKDKNPGRLCTSFPKPFLLGAEYSIRNPSPIDQRIHLFFCFHKNQQVGFARVITERPRLLTWLMFSL